MAHSFFLGCSDGQLSPQADASLGVTAGSHPAQGPKCSSGESGRQRADAVVGGGAPGGAEGEASRSAAHCLDQIMTLGAGLITEIQLPRCCLCNGETDVQASGNIQNN